MIPRHVLQVGALYGSTVLGVVLGVVVSAVNTEALGAQGYGDYKFVQNLIAISLTVLTLGVFVSGGRLSAAWTDARRRRELAGTILVAVVVLWFILGVAILLFGILAADLFNQAIGPLAIAVCGLVVGYPAQLSLENLLRGENRIYQLGIQRVAPSVLYLAVAFPMAEAGVLDVRRALFVYLGSLALATGAGFLMLRPRFTNFAHNASLLVAEVRAYGVHVYLGILAGVATLQLAGVTIAYMHDTALVGFFLLAQSITLPLATVATSVGVAFFRSFAHLSSIPTSLITWTVSGASGILVIFIVIVGPLVETIYPPEFAVIVPICYVMAAGSVVQGLGGLLNHFICAQGEGRAARNAAFARGCRMCSGSRF